MKQLISLFSLFLSVYSFSQVKIEKPSLLIGITANTVFSNSESNRRYTLENHPESYYTDFTRQTYSTNENSFYVFQINTELQWGKVYFTGALGAGVESMRLEFQNFQHSYEYNVFSEWGEDIETTKDIFIEEKNTTIMGSLELGTYFNDVDDKLRIGMGFGLDVNAYLKPKISRNEIIEEVVSTGYYQGEYFGEFRESMSYNNESIEWQNVVKKHEMPLITPKITFTTSYRFLNNFSLSAKAQMRLVLLSPIGVKQTPVIEFLVGIGVHYHF